MRNLNLITKTCNSPVQGCSNCWSANTWTLPAKNNVKDLVMHSTPNTIEKHLSPKQDNIIYALEGFETNIEPNYQFWEEFRSNVNFLIPLSPNCWLNISFLISSFYLLEMLGLHIWKGSKGIGNATIFRNIEWFVIHTTSLYLRQVEPKDECWDCSSLQPPLVELNWWTQSQKNFQLPFKNSTPKTLIKPDAPFGVGGYLHESTHHAFLFLNALEWYLL